MTIPRVTLGAKLYDVESGWGQDATSGSLLRLSQLALDSTNRVYALQRSEPHCVVFSETGKRISSWTLPTILDPHGIFITSDDYVLIVDRDAHEVSQYSNQGELLLKFGDRSYPQMGRPFNHPADVAVGPGGDIYVADGYGNSSIHRFSARGELIATWGKSGSAPAALSTPHGIWVDKKGRVLVADRENNRVQVFTSEGALIAQWSDLYHPMDIYVDSGGIIYVTDQTPRLSAFAADGTLLGRCRTPAIAHGVWGGSDGSIYLAEVGDRITRLTIATQSATRGGARAS